jgi:hypothetical protein
MAAFPFKRHLARLEGTNYCTQFSLRRGQHFGEDDICCNGWFVCLLQPISLTSIDDYLNIRVCQATPAPALLQVIAYVTAVTLKSST